MFAELAKDKNILVAPARERGLKLAKPIFGKVNITGRSREGAWIEIKIQK